MRVGQKILVAALMWAVTGAPEITGGALAQATAPRHHALSLVGKPKMSADYKAFNWVNADAPKGGRLRRSMIGSFDSLNQFPVQGLGAAGLGLLYERLFSANSDEASTAYANIAEWVSYPDDFSSATFALRDEAKFHDGKPITPEDVVFSMAALKKASPNYSTYYQNVTSVEVTGPREVTFKFDAKGNRELPQIVSEMPVLPKHWWEAKNDKGDVRDITKSSIEMPLGSGAYRVKAFEVGRSITYERVKDWWAKDLPVAKGQYNFDELHVVYYRDRVAAFEAFKTGDLDIWLENSAKSWATEFEFDAVKRGFVKPEKFPVLRVAPMQAFAMNLRRPQFQDVRVRRALNLAFDFEWANKNLFYDQYVRLNSYFDNSELASRKLPEGKELAILNELKADVPTEVFTTEWKNPTNPTPEDARKNLSTAVKLLAEAGYQPKGGVLVDSKGQPLGFEILLSDPIWDRIVQPYKGTLEKLGLKVTIRKVDSSQYQRRIDTFDFDMIVGSYPQSESPGNEQRDFFGTKSADMQGSRNVSGIKNKAVDAIIEKIVFATDRDDLVAATRALDRVLLWNSYVVPQWHLPAERVATWNVFGRPNVMPSRGSDLLRTWWFDAEKAKALAVARGK
ncbi:MAG: ABC transporter substrate-binding protein [Hyphomicrobiaceae bacterium]|nr:ABC transporter substrate-binding protein [Hyphomicrobiaceae bacterium]